MILRAIPLLMLLVAPAAAEPCRSEGFEGKAYVACTFDLTKDDLRTFWRGGDGKPYALFDTLAKGVGGEGKKLTFAINGGMFDEKFAPIGLYVEAGATLKPANTTTLTGPPGEVPNFYKKPNGVFYVAGKQAGIMETERFLASGVKADFATQSGPMLVIGGKLHPAFIEDSNDRKRRDGVGVLGPSKVVFAISDGWVNFHDFARFFRDKLGVKDALFLDGGRGPGLFAPELRRDDLPGHGGYGPMIGVIKPGK